MIGAREATEVAFLNPLRNMINRASAQHLHALVVPGPEVALAAGLDLRAAGLTVAAGPRQANVLLLLTPLSDKMLAAASVAYAQMPRPRMVLVLGEGRHAPLPKPDASAPLTPEGLKQAVGTLRNIIATQGFAAEVEDFDAPSLQSRIQYTCPMHPEIIQDEPGSCPKCGMFLVPKETSATPDPDDHTAMAASEPSHEAHGDADKAAKYTCPMHPEVTSDTPGNCPKCGMNLVKPEEATDHSHHHTSHAPSEGAAKYVCPMHPEVVSDEPGSCPKCGMFLEEVKETGGEGNHNHAHHSASETAAKYTCPMHPEVTSNEPGSCPKCGMFLEEVKEAGGEDHHDHDHTGHASAETPAKYTCPMHPEITSDTPGNCPKCGMNLVKVAEQHEDGPHNHASMAAHAPSASVSSEDSAHAAHGSGANYTCPMHPEVTSNEPGSCPKCGMFLEEVKDAASEGGDAHHSASETAAKYVCPMHPEVTSDAPGSCPKCGMFLEEVKKASDEAHQCHDHAPADAPAKYTCPMHPEVTSDTPGNCPKCGMNLVEAAEEAHEGHAHHDTGETTAYVCPMHPEVTSDAAGNCPKCGMNLVKAEPAESGHAGGHDHGGGSALLDGLVGLEPGFMSMIEMTDGTPRSSDGLQMEWITTPFGPFFPGLPGGLTLELELDGDTVVSAKTGSLTGPQDLLQNGPLAAADYVAALGAQMPLATVAYQLLACRAIEAAAKLTPGEGTKTARSAALARERITSHVLWLSQLGRQLGLKGIEREAATLHLLVHGAAPSAITALGPRLKRLANKARRTWFLSRRLATIGTLPPDAAWDGPTSADPTAAGRLSARLDEIPASLSEISKATSLSPPALADIGQATGTGHASVQTARGKASLHVELRNGAVVSATLETPSSRHVSLLNPLIEQQELADALVAISSLDLSPWELPA